jgi:hypothetical protein
MQTLYSFAVAYANKTGKEFSSEEIRREYFKLNPKADFSVMGNLMKSLLKDKVIKKKGFKNSELPAAKGAVIRTYISISYSIKQSNNRRLKQPEIVFPQN